MVVTNLSPNYKNPQVDETVSYTPASSTELAPMDQGSTPIGTGGSTVATTLEHGQFGLRALKPQLSAKTLQSCKTAIKQAIKPTKGAQILYNTEPQLFKSYSNPTAIISKLLDQVRLTALSYHGILQIQLIILPAPTPETQGYSPTRTLSLAKQLRADTNNYQEISDQHPFNRSKQTEIVGEGLNEINLRTLIQPPFLDWIRQNKGWNVFGVHEPWLDSSIREASEGYPCLSVSLSLKGE
ncbi:uncharacterized protein PGTG_06387 [Puccinia graminis f. sp. tritici CRL 75-36-700-3]|uniref:Uncharacterized protein n=1 Tax=Puccinia graminis f. sp. tritici (strain CRL 75-36-700-3 / race SCCL) TaxID=418459 RepID=E3K857_PUCGT|nr:uncharacterized protein PGTG_06387 [Puccinia graminis f. sp. tritici CRL 75-36-700-3]EFP80431.1 hypothetical protein PGTG_06387 [Puccinia graminis f. sp. tritici CRL 75-36-700-3]